jgi:heme-degrading monooxygenase HmoA
MIEVLWEFVVCQGKKAEFEKHYSATGTWGGFFRKSPAYHGTSLLADETDRYITWDRWESQDAYEDFRQANMEEYAELDRGFEALRVTERCLGIFKMK